MNNKSKSILDIKKITIKIEKKEMDRKTACYEILHIIQIIIHNSSFVFFLFKSTEYFFSKEHHFTSSLLICNNLNHSFNFNFRNFFTLS